MIKLAKIFDRVLDRGPGRAEKRLIGATGENVVAIDHQNKFGVQILPVVCILPSRLVDGIEGIALGHAEIMGNSANLFALVGDGRTTQLRLPHPETLLRPFLRHGIGKLQQDLFVDLRPELEQRQGGVKAHIEGAVVRIIETLQQCEGGRKFWIRTHRPAPESSSIRKGVEFVEEHAAVPEGFARVLDVRSLPLIDGVAPLGGVQQAVTRDVPCITA